MASPRVEPPKKTQFYALASIAIVLALLYFGQEVLIPLALAVLIAFLLAPVVTALERLRLGRVTSTLLVVVAALALMGGFGWIVEQRFVEIVNKLPDYRHSIQTKFQRLTRSGGLIDKAREELRQTVQEAPTTQSAATRPSSTTQNAVTVATPPTEGTGTLPRPLIPPVIKPTDSPGQLVPPSPDEPWAVRLYPQPATALELFGEYVGKVISPVATAGLVIVFIIFMLIGRENLRDRMILLAGGAGGGRLHVTTQAFDDAATRIGRFLTAQSLINLCYGVAVALGLWIIDRTMGNGEGGIRTALLGGMICAVMRFIPYIGPWLGAAVPLAIAFAAFPGNGVFFVTLAMFVGMEILVSQAVEPHVLGSSTGVSPMAVLVAAVFWTWLWGPIGLLLSTPLTVLLVVMGKYIPQLAVLDVLLGDDPVLDPTTRIYQRLIAGDDEDATELALEHLEERPLEAVYDQILIPALAEAERDWHHGKLDDARHAWIRQGLKDIVQALGERQQDQDNADAAELAVLRAKGHSDREAPSKAPPSSPGPVARPALQKGASVHVRCLPAHDDADQVVGLMLAQVLGRRGFVVTVPDTVSLASEMVASIDSRHVDIVVVSALPPKAALHARYLTKLIQARYPDLKIVVGLWTNNKTSRVELDSVQTVTSLDSLQDKLDQITPMILLESRSAVGAAIR
ncbi:MAG TPA: AI-2E family transporter [Tepidisphaeraceae bacterium]|jgi:predicted PurR-regulated permease PerM